MAMAQFNLFKVATDKKNRLKQFMTNNLDKCSNPDNELGSSNPHFLFIAGNTDCVYCSFA
jgi:hypothetical protein